MFTLEGVEDRTDMDGVSVHTTQKDSIVRNVTTFIGIFLGNLPLGRRLMLVKVCSMII